MRILIKICMLLVLLTSCLTGYSKNLDLKSIAEHTPVEVSSIVNCGVWDYKNKSGYFRFLHIDHPAGSGYFLQKISVDYKSKLPEIKLHSVMPIIELNEDLFNFSMESYQCNSDNTVLTIKGNSLSSNSTYEFSIGFELTGDYKIINKRRL